MTDANIILQNAAAELVKEAQILYLSINNKDEVIKRNAKKNCRDILMIIHHADNGIVTNDSKKFLYPDRS